MRPFWPFFKFLYPRSSGDLEALPDGIKDDINSFAHFFSHEQSAKWLARPEPWKAVMNVFDDEEESKPGGLAAHANELNVCVFAAPSEALCRDFIATFEDFRRNHSDREVSFYEVVLR